MSHTVGKYLIIAGIILVIAGVSVYFTNGRIFKWFGNLPGDIRIEREGFRFYFPVTTMILISLILTVFIKLVKKLF